LCQLMLISPGEVQLPWQELQMVCVIVLLNIVAAAQLSLVTLKLKLVSRLAFSTSSEILVNIWEHAERQMQTIV
jgi:hypothetical protein